MLSYLGSHVYVDDKTIDEWLGGPVMLPKGVYDPKTLLQPNQLAKIIAQTHQSPKMNAKVPAEVNSLNTVIQDQQGYYDSIMHRLNIKMPVAFWKNPQHLKIWIQQTRATAIQY